MNTENDIPEEIGREASPEQQAVWDNELLDQLEGGPWHVRLLIPVDAAGPIEAVEEFIFDITNFGLRSYLYRVVHEVTGDAFFVQGGRIVSEEEAIRKMQEDDDEGDLA